MRQKIGNIMNRKRLLTFLLVLANVTVANAVYNLWAAEKDTPVLESLKKNPVCKLWAKGKSWSSRKPRINRRGVVTGTCRCTENPVCIIEGKIICEGETIHGVKVIKIHEDRVEFEKNGRKWTQQIQGRPNSAWREAD